ncbi:BtpA family membrane complex biogenesis protein, partial [bacterium]|nr:BtpA family membrane complex biogenesis protein [bacterium]
ADVDIADTAKACEFLGADGVIVTGAATGDAAEPADLRAVAGACALPVLVGSGATADSVAGLLQHADAVIVGSWLKRDGQWFREPDPARVEAFVRAARA